MQPEVITMPTAPAQTTLTVGAAICKALASWGVTTSFGVISIHNMPILDPMGVDGDIRFVAARGEAGALNMADAYARVKNHLGVAFTSTGTAAGNAAGAMVEALTAGSPVLHITGQVPVEHLDANRAYIHEAPDQLTMLKAVSKRAFRIDDAASALDVLAQAASCALSAPRGPVSIEIAIDVQAAQIPLPESFPELEITTLQPEPTKVAALVERLRTAKRPMILLGGGARGAGAAATALADAGVGIVSSTCGRGIVAEDHPMSLGAFNCTDQVQALYAACDLLIVAGSRLRGNETWTYKLGLPADLVQIDVDATSDGRCYPNAQFIQGDAPAVLAALAQVAGELSLDPALAGDIAAARETMVAALRSDVGPYTALVDALQARMPEGAAWVRDVTISNSMWGNRYLRVGDQHAGVHAVGGGIGQGLPMGVGAALGREAGAVVLSGDGGLSLCLGELLTAVDEKAPLTLVLMNDNGYGVIRNIQDTTYGGRHYYSNILIPDFALLAQSIGLPHRQVSDLADIGAALDEALAIEGPAVVEVDMVSIGGFAKSFAGPPTVERK
ncbi:thiamine pyrophosphate-binding protein [Novosphingobium rosa]|uniref:thiamine pyrophosphate-binding protein n=1 Tax=Novosphingobium rosa TaxID=76978 RepID=UPI000AF5D685|nr:thiamine pyrophosphate-binding protein [Novosphingobium rosa]